VPDVLTGALPEQDPDPFRTLKSLKELTLEADAAKRTPGQIAIRRSLGDVDIGLTYVPTAATFEKPRIETSRTEPRKRVYGHCLSVDSVEVRLPVEHIKTTIAVEVHRSASCYQYAVAHEAKHYREAWLTMRLIAMGISEHLQTKYPGPANALPAPTNLLSLYYSNIQSEIASIVRQELTASKTRHLEFDEQRRTGAAACAEFQGAAER
jgi:hypothetical protein